MRGIGLALFAVFAFATTVLAAAEKCPISDDAQAKAGGLHQAIEAAMKAEFSCEGAYRIMELCQLGSSGDNAFSAIVLKKCEPRFLPKALPATKAAYEKARAKCNKVAEKNEGSMYQSQAAVCIARSGRDFARKYGTKS